MNANTSGLRLRPIIVTLALIIGGSSVLPGSPLKAAAERAIKPVAELWQIAPAPPKIPETDRLAELRSRRQAVISRMNKDSMMILLSAEPRVYTNDVDYHYRQENNLYYLTGIKRGTSCWF
jgi:Aminopeptidase P, N-terminal domain